MPTNSCMSQSLDEEESLFSLESGNKFPLQDASLRHDVLSIEAVRGNEGTELGKLYQEGKLRVCL